MITLGDMSFPANRTKQVQVGSALYTSVMFSVYNPF